MAARRPGKSRGEASWDTEETIWSAFISDLQGSSERDNRLELAPRRPGLPIIRPPEGCENMKPDEFKNIQYQDLPTPTSIRILKIFPGEDSYSSFALFRPPVRCSIVVVDLEDEDVAYDALSYTWGDPCTLYLNEDEISSPEAWSARAFDIEIDGKPVSVAANLYAALLGLRSHITHQKDPQFSKVPQSSGCFWIDALCINQDDLKEKSSQVMMMSRIYKQASLVFAWLGGNDRLSAQALHDLSMIEAIGSKGQRDPKELRGFDIRSDETYQRLGIRKLNYTSWIGIYLFLNRAWFKRAWIVQEIALAREPWFMCGRQHCNLPLILRSLQTLQQSRWLDQLRQLAEPVIQNFRAERDYSSKITAAESSVKLYRPRKTHLVNGNIGGIIEDVRISMGTSEGVARDNSAPKRPRLLKLLEWYRYTESGDARDKIYAFIGLSSEQERRPLTVDYELSPEQVFIETTRYLLSSLQSLEVLSLKKARFEAEATLDLPSWVPDFTVQDLTPPINQHTVSSASKGLGALDLLYSHDGKLQLKGLKIDKVTDIGVEFRWAEMPELSLLLQKVTPPAGQTQFEVFWRTILLDSYDGDTPAIPSCGGWFLELLSKHVHSQQVVAAVSLQFVDEVSRFRASYAARTATAPEEVRQFLSFEQARLRVGEMYTAWQRIIGNYTKADGIIFPPEFVAFERRRSEAQSKEDDDAVIADFYDELRAKTPQDKVGGDITFQVSGTTGGRLLFVTEEGRLGMGAAMVEVGDEVWVLAGADVPLILRPCDESGEEFRLVGEAYVHGVMQGEAVAGVKGGELRRLNLV